MAVTTVRATSVAMRSTEVRSWSTNVDRQVRDVGAALGELVLAAKHQRIVRPQHLVRLRVGERHLHRPGEEISRGQLLFVEADGLDRDREDSPVSTASAPCVVWHDAVLAAADELGAHLLREDLLDLEEGAAVLERRDADDSGCSRAGTSRGRPARSRSPELASAERTAVSAQPRG